ncbi:hypothetical protein [Clostridium sp. C2-6-12]|uniref:hypothetical protein n=1 Tax=Clostridium sp. C2-6-12 TaxID=2698832 RepID=UPI00136BF7BE|nr:hypothetical protein [Clostridium sp. C2-6-12]
MIYLSALLLCLFLNLTPLVLSLIYVNKRIHFSKSIILLFSIITSIGIVVFMYAGRLILNLFIPKVGNIFGAVCLSLIGVYYIVEYMRILNESAGYDTSYYYEPSLNYRKLLDFSSSIPEINNLNDINIYSFIKFSAEFLLNNILIYISAGITGININICVFVNFILSLIVFYLGYLNIKDNIILFLGRHFYLFGGILLITLGLLETYQ